MIRAANSPLSGALALMVAMVAAVFIFFSTVFGISAAMAAKDSSREMKFKDFPFDVTRGDRLIVQAVRGHVRLVTTAQGKPGVVRARKVLTDATKPGAQVRFDELSFSVRREGSVVMIEEKGPNGRQDWIDWSRIGQPEIFFEIESPSTTAEIHMHSGTVNASGWKDQLAISLQDGKLVSTDGEGALRVTMLRGELKIEKQKGAIEIESHSGKIAISNSEGGARIHSFTGESSVTNHKGDMNIRSKIGAVNIAKMVGQLTFDNGRGRFEGTGIEGGVRGVNDDGSVNLQLAGEADVSIETQEGAVSVKPPSGAGVLLKLSNEDGAIVAPESLKASKGSGANSIVVRMDGVPKGVIVLRSKRGTVRVR